MRTLYPDIEPYQVHTLRRETLSNGETHTLYVEECGNPEGKPVVFLHGGPGSGCRPSHRCFFDPDVYRIILFDQRGCGRSTPLGELENNTLPHLVEDMEVIRDTLNIDHWMLFGGSWGSTLSLAYAQAHPDKVTKMILRGTFLGRQQDVDWVYAEGGASRLFPEAWQTLMDSIEDKTGLSVSEALFQQLQSDDDALVLKTISALDLWEGTIVTLRDHEYVPDPDKTPGPVAHSLIQLHYALHDCFLAEQPLIAGIDKIRHIPTHIIHGRYDLVCPVVQSHTLKQHWPEASLEIIPLAGHAAGEPALIDALVTATDAWAHD